VENEATIPENSTAEEKSAVPGGSVYPRLSVFAYTVEGLAPLYRAIMRLFVEAKASYRLELRPAEIAAELERRSAIPGDLATRPSREELDRALDQLSTWGNLRRTHDTARVATLEDFRRRHYLYQLTPAGEAAERAVASVIEALENSGSLQTVMLGAILRNLAALAEEIGKDSPSPAALYEGIFNVTEQFTALTENASTFMARLHEAIDASEVETEAFIVYKHAVIAYLEEFIGELARLAPRIEAQIRAVEEGGEVEKLVRLAAEADRAPSLGGERDVSGRLEGQWRGLSRWFVGTAEEPATVERLRSAARRAINRILQVLERLHDKRFRRVSRTADLLQLARWFESAEGETDAHRLFQNAFGLASARHFGGFDEERDLVRASVSWWRGTPVEISQMLRESGRIAPSGAAARVVDHSAARRRLAEAHARRHRRFLRALERFAGRGPLPVGELEPLSDEEFELFLELLDRLLALPPDTRGLRRGRSRDGRLGLRLEAPADGERAVVHTAAGRLELPAYTLTVEDLVAAREAVG